MRKIVALSAAGAVALAGGILGASQAFAKDVTLTVDGVTHQVRTTDETVAGVLRAQGVVLGEHDVVAPAAGAPLTDHSEVTVRYGRPVTATVDGKTTTLWTTATTVEEALAQLNVRGDAVDVSTSRSTVIGRDGLAFTVASFKNVTIKAAGKVIPVSVAGTVRDALAKAGVSVDADDKVSATLSEPLKAGMVITAVKVEEKTVSKTVSLPYATVTKKDAKLDQGTSKVQTPGKNGAATQTWSVRVEDGKVVKNALVKTVVTSKAVSEVKLVGTKTVTEGTGGGNLSKAVGTTCTASFYDEPQGTASGEVFNPNAMTAAHKTLPLGTRLKVSNAATGATVIVRINDRGPYIGGRCLDLSRASFAAIANIGAGTVTVTYQVI